MRNINRRLSSKRGQALIEFAFLLPLVLVFLLGMVDFGIAIDRRVVLQHATREGARFAAVGGQAFTTGVAATEQEVKDYTASQSQGIADPNGALGSDNYIEVCYEDANGNGVLGDVGDNVIVRVHYVHDFVSGFTDIFDTSVGAITMTPSGQARVERPVAWAAECAP